MEPDRGPVLHETTLTRFDGSAISKEELESIRYSAIATALTVARTERELREPWAETRTPEEILRAVQDLEPSDMRLAETLWETAEPKGDGQDRARFNEFGFYSNQMLPMDFSPRARPETLELLVKKMLSEHDDSTPKGKLLAAWRHFAPATKTQAKQYLASNWRIELDYITPVTLQVNESLLGPHLRSSVVSEQGISFPGPVDTYEGYGASALLLDLLTPGSNCPVGDAVEALAELAEGRPARLPFTITAGRSELEGEMDERFLQAALGGLRNGASNLESLPAAASRIVVTFSYLVDLGEARATLSLRRLGNKWELELLEYEPAAASLMGGSARLDLMPGIRELARRNQAG